MLKKAYLEITNACNLSCEFCHGTKREIRFMAEDEFRAAAAQLRRVAEYLYLHVMGEPLLHPKLNDFLAFAAELGFKVIITTNGTLLGSRSDLLLSSKALHKVSISLHCVEANSVNISMKKYLSECFEFCAAAAEKGIIAVMRLWNVGGADRLNESILSAMHSRFSGQWKETYSGYKIADRIFLEWGEKFEWPDLDAAEVGAAHTCYGLRDQVGVLSDGTVVPCCLDADGAIALGNIFEDDIQNILSSPRAQKLKRSFETRNVCEELCLRCDFAAKLTAGKRK